MKLLFLLVMLATNATGEHSFSALRGLKSYLRITSQERLDHLMILHVHKEITDSLHLSEVANEFTCNNEHFSNILGKFNYFLNQYS